MIRRFSTAGTFLKVPCLKVTNDTKIVRPILFYLSCFKLFHQSGGDSSSFHTKTHFQTAKHVEQSVLCKSNCKKYPSNALAPSPNVIQIVALNEKTVRHKFHDATS